MKLHRIMVCLVVFVPTLYQMVYSQEYGRQLDSLSLVALYDSTDGANWITNTNWLSSEPIENWYGVTAEGERITRLQLRNNNLSGVIPIDICNLTACTYLDFYVNNLSGPIPQNIGNLSGLTHLYLNHNQLSGPIPQSMWQLTDLQQLYLNSNNLKGSLPDDIGNLVNLEYLVLFANSFSDSIPNSIGNLSRLRELNIYRNEFSGALPSAITNLDSLRELTLWNNILEGPFPEDIDKLTHLESISIANNRFSGTIPESIGNLEHLIFLDLGSNSFEESIPLSIGNLTGLTFLRLGSNHLSGQIPDTLGNLINLTIMYLNYNQFDGPIPASLGKLTALTALLVNSNQLSGAVPDEITNLINMNTFFISSNQLDILPDLSVLNNLSDFAIQNNCFTFEDIEPNIGFSSGTFTYTPQADVGIEIDTMINVGASYSMAVTVGGVNNLYQWYKNDQAISGANSDSYQISSAVLSDSGEYVCRVTNSVVSDLTISSKVIHIVVVDPTAVAETPLSLPLTFRLDQNYPNPFNPMTIINYQLPVTSYVELSIYNLLGQKVATLVAQIKNAGYHQVEWNGIDEQGNQVASGIYIYKITTSEFSATKKMVLLR